MSLRPVCGDCSVVMDVEKNGVVVWGEVHNFVRHGDLFRCPSCSAQTVANMSKGMPKRDIEDYIDRLRENMGDDWVDKYYFELDESVNKSDVKA